MPQAGTRKVELEGGQVLYLPEEDARITELLRDGNRLRQRIRADKGALEIVHEQLIAIAARRRGPKGPVHLTSATGEKAKVSWSKHTEIDSVAVEKLKGPLGKAWDSLFIERVSYVLASRFKEWMEAPQGALERLKERVRSVFDVSEHVRVDLYDLGETDRRAA